MFTKSIVPGDWVRDSNSIWYEISQVEEQEGDQYIWGWPRDSNGLFCKRCISDANLIRRKNITMRIGDRPLDIICPVSPSGCLCYQERCQEFRKCVCIGRINA